MIYTAGPISGAHFNPMVTSVFMMARMQVWTLHYLSMGAPLLCTHTTVHGHSQIGLYKVAYLADVWLPLLATFRTQEHLLTCARNTSC